MSQPKNKDNKMQTAKRQKPRHISWWCSPTSGKVEQLGQICYTGKQPQQYSLGQSLTDPPKKQVRAWRVA